MFCTTLGIVTRICSNSLLNVFQKMLTSKGNHSSVVNFYSYFGLVLLSILILPFCSFNFSMSLFENVIIMGLLGALGNYFIIKALSIGELSALAPINSYKPVVAMAIGFLYLKEIPSLSAILGIVLIIAGTIFLYGSIAVNNGAALWYRVLALVFSGTEAVFIKKIILLTNVPASFVLWAVSGFVFSSLFVVSPKTKISLPNIKYLSALIFSIGIMQLSTNFVFSKIQTSYALALFQLSTVLSIILGANIFKETDIVKKIIASLIMITGAVIILLN